MAGQTDSKEELNFFKFASIVFDEIPKALRQTFISMWDSKFGGLPGYQLWDDSVAVRNILLRSEGGRTDIPTTKSIQDWNSTALFKATIFAKTFVLPSGKKTLAELYLKGRKPKPNPFHPTVNSSSGDQNETLTLAIDQLRLLRNALCHATNLKIIKPDFDKYVQLAKDAFLAVKVPTVSIDAIGCLAEADFPTAKVNELNECLQKELQASNVFLQEKVIDKITDIDERAEGLSDQLIGIREVQETTNEELKKIRSDLMHKNEPETDHDLGDDNKGDLSVSPSKQNWKRTSIAHREKFEKLIQVLNSEPNKVTEINGVSVCFEDEFCIGKGCSETKVYIGLCQDGMEKAVKRVPSQLCESLGLNEKSILTSKVAVESPRIVSYWFYDDTSNPQFAHLILNLYEKSLKEYVAEQNLEDLKKNAPKMMRQILEGLETLHSRQPKILHRDLKPSNILVNIEEDLLLADFGISKILTVDQTTYRGEAKGTTDWIAVESIESDENVEVKYKRKSDIQVVGMLGFYILTKGKYVYGPKCDRLHNQYHDKPVGLKNLADPVAKDLITWMLRYEICERPYAEEALKHPFLQSLEKQSEMVCKVGNEPEIKKGDVTSEVVQKINAHPLLANLKWKSQLPSRVLKDCCRRCQRPYDDRWTECLRFIRNQTQHWKDDKHPVDVEEIVGEARVYFMTVFPLLPVVVHQTIRCYPDWKTRQELKDFFA